MDDIFLDYVCLGLTGWQLSLRALGTCAYLGHIYPGSITRAIRWPHAGSNLRLAFVWDPTITIANQRFCSDRYRALTARLFGDKINPATLSEFDRFGIEAFDKLSIDGLERFEYAS